VNSTKQRIQVAGRQHMAAGSGSMNVERGSSGLACSGAIKTRGSKCKAELEGICTTRSKVLKLDVKLKHPFYRRQKGRHY
jgi:hypothetical protein